jgi:hypothetical protein
MKLTNKFNLPDTFVNVIQRPTYSKGKAHISATELINSPRIVQLKKKHWEDITQDASEMVWSLFGSAVHNILEHGKDKHHIVEERLHTNFEGWDISGAIDLQEVEEDGIVINDYKVTSAWAVINEKAEWGEQLNIYAWLVERVKKIPVKKVQIVAIIRDWSARDAVNREGYPPSPIAVIEYPLSTFTAREEYITKKIEQHNEAYFAMTTGEELQECTPEDMWEKPTTYALKKTGGVRAKKVYSILTEAEAGLAEAGKGHEIETREGERTRCQKYCQVSQFCSQYQKYLDSNTITIID